MPSFIDHIYNESSQRRHTRFWLFSDLQQSNPDLAERYFRTAMEDFTRLDTPIDGICYLGDASEGIDLDGIRRMIDMQLGFLDALNCPIYYAIGNHELEYFRYALKNGLPPFLPFYDAVKDRPNWHLVSSQEDFWFKQEMPEFTMLFFSDHAAVNGDWYGFHEVLPQHWKKFTSRKPYPYTKEDWLSVRDQFATQEKPVFTFAHCAFPGGNRPSEYLEQLLPLPKCFRAHFHGHAHIGDEKWAGANLYRQIACVDNQPILQFDIASLDHLRGNTVRSAFFDYYGDGQFGVFFRDHCNARWEQFFISEHDAQSAGIPEDSPSDYPDIPFISR